MLFRSRRAISTSTAEKVKSMMVKAVSSGVSSNARIPGVQVAGKTGTAQNGENDPYTLWFTGFAPAKNPEVAVTVLIEDGGGRGQSGRGNTLAAPIAKKIMINGIRPRPFLYPSIRKNLPQLVADLKDIVT